MKTKRFLSLLCLLWMTGSLGISAQDLIEGYTRILYPEDLQEGKSYFIISDRTAFKGNSTGKPKGMSSKLDSYTINWDNPSKGIYFVYWGDFDDTQEGFQWTAEQTSDGKWAFKNKAKGEYLGVKNSYDDDVLFSPTAVGYTLTDLEDGAGRFYLISSDSPYSPHVQGFLRSDRPNNSLAKQSTGFDSYIDDVATNGYPARWQIYDAESYTGSTYISYASEIKEGEQYYIISDRKSFNGNSTGQPKAMSTLQANYTIRWGDQYVYWGDLNKEADGFIWTAEKVGDEGQWAFLNKENNKYLGGMNTSPAEVDIVFSATPIGYALSDLEDGAGRFYMTSSDSEHSPHVQGYLRSDRPNNSLAKQNVGDDSYPGDGASNGYPGRWKLMKVNASAEPQSEFYKTSNGYYIIIHSDVTPSSNDIRNIFRIEAIDRANGLYSVQNYVTEEYVGSTTDDCNYVTSAEAQSLTFRSVEGERSSLYICNAAGDTLFQEKCKLQKVDSKALESPIAQLKLSLARKMNEVGNPDLAEEGSLSEEQLQTFKSFWQKAEDAMLNNICDILYVRLIADLDAASKGTYSEPVYNKYQKQNLRVMAYNVQHCAGNHGSLNLPRTAQAIMAQQADVVALQELDSVFSSRSDYKYQIKELSEATGMYGIFCSALTGYGIGMLSKELPLSVKVVSLTNDFEPRRMLMVEFNDYVYASIHVGLSAAARRGSGPIIKAAAEEWVEKGKPLIIAGDFNDDGTDSEMQGARGELTAYLAANGFTFHSDRVTPTWSDGTYVIDHIISYDPIGGVEKVSYEVINDKVTSDHMPIAANLIIGFDDPNGIEGIKAGAKASASGKVYGINGTLVSDSADSISSLPEGIYIVDGKKLKK